MRNGVPTIIQKARCAFMGAILASLSSGCTIAPHGSRATHRVWTYQGRADGLIRYEVMTDRSAGGGGQFGTFTSLDNLVVVHTNSTMQLGGTLTVGQAYIGTDTNLARNITALGDAAGTAAGAALGTAVHKAVGLP